MRAMRVVERGTTDANLHVGDARAARGAIDQGAKLRADGDEAGVADRVAEEVRRLLVGCRGCPNPTLGIYRRSRQG